MATAGDWAPTERDIEHYEHIWKSAPFVAKAETSSQAESLVARFALTGFARVGDDEVIFLLDRKSLNRFSITRGAPRNGVELISVRGEDIKTLAAKIRANGEVATIGFDASEAAASTPPLQPNQTQASIRAPETEKSSAPTPTRNLQRKTIRVQ